MKRTTQTLLAVVLVLGLGLPFWKFVVAVEVPPPTAPPRDLGPTPVQVRTLAPQEVILTVEAFGNLEPRRKVALSSELVGRIKGVFTGWRPGALVEPGELLIVLEKHPFQLDLRAAEARRRETLAAVDAAEVDLQGALRAREKAVEQREIAAREFARQVELAGFASDSLRDRAEAALVQAELDEETTLLRSEGAKAALAGAQARDAQAAVAVSQADDVLARTEIRAPFAGRLRGQAPGLGTLAGPGEVLGELFDIAELVLTVRVPERDLLLMRRGLTVAISFPSDPGLVELLRVPGEVTGIDPASDTTTRRGNVEIGLSAALWSAARPPAAPGNGADAAPIVLPAGLFARASIEVERIADALWIGRRHVRFKDGRPRAYVVVEQDGRSLAAERELVLTREHGEGFLVQSGLRPGDVLITHPLDRMQSGSPVTVEPVTGPGDRAP